ncbi:thymidylate synthase [Actinoplanes sp. NPDC051346]|uniref:thymidylate synthase n=1 Tax=Actinoplanes sp. NPDC051346 TaxID=3155048 RepID=UPI003444B4CF
MTLTPTAFATFTDVYAAVLRGIRHHHVYDTAGRGDDALEVTDVSFRLTDPTDRTPYLATRRANIAFNHAEALWYLTGRDDADMISYYAPSLAKLSIDGVTLTGTAYGPRLFASGVDGRSQFDRVIELLRADPDTKRAAMVIMRPDELIDPGNPDVACTLGLQFLLREGRLHMSAYMRGNDAYIGLLGDTFAFTFIQEYAARRLGIPVGYYSHHVGSMHLNVLDLDKVDIILQEAATATPPVFEPRFMPVTTDDDLALIMEYENALRVGDVGLSPAAAAALPLPAYWRQVLLLFEAYRQIRHTTHPVTTDVADVLDPGHRWLLAARWPTRITKLPVCAGQPS